MELEEEALQGVRVVDFSWAAAGPFCTMLVALMGAEVIRIESRKRPDMMRRSQVAGSRFHDLNLHKRSLTLDLSQPQGVELAKRLIRVSDAVVQNFRPGVMERLGLDYLTLSQLQPSLIMASLSACGATGPLRHYAGYAATFASLSGLSHATGYPDGPPTEYRISIDLSVGATVAFALLAALNHCQRTGRGQHIDISAWESTSFLIGDVIMEYTLNKRVRPRLGNRDEIMAPHNCYPCLGEDKWVSIAVSGEEEWRALCHAMGNPPWSKEERFADSLNRWQNQEALDELISQWTRGQTHYAVTKKLQEAGVAALPSFNSKELFYDPHLRERGYYREVEDGDKGKRFMVGPAWKLSETPAHMNRLGPSLGEDNEYVLGELLGMKQSEIASLTEEKVLY